MEQHKVLLLLDEVHSGHTLLQQTVDSQFFSVHLSQASWLLLLSGGASVPSLSSMAKPLLTATLIMKNEASNLPRCLAALNSFKPLISHVYIYDTGSTDNSVEIAESMGATVQRGYWDNDFARARNEALAMTDSLWALVVDIDEVPHINQASMRKMLRSAPNQCSALSVEIRSMTTVGKVGNSSRMSRIARIGRAHFAHKLHETLVAIDNSPLPAKHASHSSIWLEHFGYSDQETLLKKLIRNEKVSTDAIAELKGKSHCEGQLLGHHLNRAITRFGAMKWAEAIEDVEMVRSIDPNLKSLHWAYALELLTKYYISENLLDKAQGVVDELGVMESNESYRNWLQAKIYLAQDESGKALTLLREVDFLVLSVGVLEQGFVLLQDRMQAAVAEGEYEEALACAFSLIVDHDVVNHALPTILTLWKDRPVSDLATMLLDAKPEVVDYIALLTGRLEGMPNSLSRELRKQRTIESNNIPVAST